MRYSLQIMNFSGYTYYEIIDTQNNNKTIHKTKDYNEALKKLETLNTELFYNANSDKWHTKAEVINDIINMLDCTEEEAENHLEYSIKHGLIFTEEYYNKHFKPYEN